MFRHVKVTELKGGVLRVDCLDTQRVTLVQKTGNGTFFALKTDFKNYLTNS
jgi:hypothetical protein